MEGTPVLTVRAASLMQPLTWLRRGWLDLWRCPAPGLLHGAACAVFGLLLLALARDRFWLLAGAFSGFLLVAPIVATGLYAVSRAIERADDPGKNGARPSLATALGAWRSGDRRLVLFGALLALAGTGWVLTSAALVTGFAPAPVTRPLDFLRHVVLSDRSWLFEAWLLLGALLAAPIFASTVVAIPLLLDRKEVSVLRAVLASWRAVLAAPAALALWAALIMALSLAGMLTALAGLVVIVPWLAHASWHAYRDLIGPAADVPAGSR
jgi:uncharacterized membrane protein